MIVSLGVGIGVNTAVFSWIQAMVLQPIPGVADAGGVQLVEPRADTGSYPGVSWLEYRDLRDAAATLPDLFAYRMVPFNVGERGRARADLRPARLGQLLLGARPDAGARPLPARRTKSTRAGGAPVVVISYEYWQTRFAGSPTAIGQHDARQRSPADHHRRRPRTVSGHGDDADVRSVGAGDDGAGAARPDRASSRIAAQRGYAVAGRLAPRATRGAGADRARRRDAASWRTTIRRPNATMHGRGAAVLAGAARAAADASSRALAMLQGVMLLLLLAVCGNTANLMLARASARHREVGVRLALGAGPWRVVSLLLTENVAAGAARRRARRGDRGVGDRRAARGADDRRVADQDSRPSIDGVGLAFALGARACCAA